MFSLKSRRTSWKLVFLWNTAKQICSLWWVVADKIDSFGPDLSPHIHVVAHVDSTADPTAGSPDQLQNRHQRDHMVSYPWGKWYIWMYTTYLCVMSANWARASEGAVGVTLLGVRVREVLYLVVPGLHVECGWTISEETCWLITNTILTVSLYCGSLNWWIISS